MKYRQPLSERLAWFLEKAWHCWVMDRHHVKMDSHNKCYRCGLLIPPIINDFTYINGRERR